ncbi:MAG: hypothetical protein K8R36_15045 [Planctomycetales bacterium]|nr:hypothetical protein [Planctomycetales bacterium]
MLQTLTQPFMQSRLAETNVPDELSSPIYYVAWRSRQSHPWRSEEFTSRYQAHHRYFALLDRGVEVYMVRRQPLEF